MGENAIRVAAASARREWWDLLRLDDPRYPRPPLVAGLRAVGRLGWLPVTVYLGNAATNLINTLASHGVAASARLDGLASVLELQGAWRLAQQNPMAAVGLLALLAVLGFLIYLAQRDTRREAAIVSMRQMAKLVQERAARTMTAETLRDELRTLQAELAADSSALRKAADEAANEPSGQVSPLLTERLTRLSAISEMLSRDLGSQALWDEMMRAQMSAWERRQRLLSAGMGAATIIIGGVLPLLLNPTAFSL